MNNKELKLALQSAAGQKILEYIGEYVLDGYLTSMDGLAAIIELRRVLKKIQKAD